MTEHWRGLWRRNDGCCDLLARLKEAYDEQHEEIERLRAIVVKYEAIAALQHGTMAQTQAQQNESYFQIVDAPPDAPR